MAASLGQARQVRQAALRAQHPAQMTRSQEMTMLWMPSSPTLTSELEGASTSTAQAGVCSAGCEAAQKAAAARIVPCARQHDMECMSPSACKERLERCKMTANRGMCSCSTASGTGGLCSACSSFHLGASGLQMLFAWDVLLSAVQNLEQLFWTCQNSGRHREQGVWLGVSCARLGLGLQNAVRGGCQPRKARKRYSCVALRPMTFL